MLEDDKYCKNKGQGIQGIQRIVMEGTDFKIKQGCQGSSHEKGTLQQTPERKRVSHENIQEREFQIVGTASASILLAWQRSL